MILNTCVYLFTMLLICCSFALSLLASINAQSNSSDTLDAVREYPPLAGNSSYEENNVHSPLNSSMPKHEALTYLRPIIIKGPGPVNSLSDRRRIFRGAKNRQTPTSDRMDTQIHPFYPDSYPIKRNWRRGPDIIDNIGSMKSRNPIISPRNPISSPRSPINSPRNPYSPSQHSRYDKKYPYNPIRIPLHGTRTLGDYNHYDKWRRRHDILETSPSVNTEFKNNLRPRFDLNRNNGWRRQSSLGPPKFEEGNSFSGSLQSALNSLWVHKKRAYKNLLSRKIDNFNFDLNLDSVWMYSDDGLNLGTDDEYINTFQYSPKDHLPEDRLPEDNLPGDYLPDKLPDHFLGDHLPGDYLPVDRLPVGRLPIDRSHSENRPFIFDKGTTFLGSLEGSFKDKEEMFRTRSPPDNSNYFNKNPRNRKNLRRRVSGTKDLGSSGIKSFFSDIISGVTNKEKLPSYHLKPPGSFRKILRRKFSPPRRKDRNYLTRNPTGLRTPRSMQLVRRVGHFDENWRDNDTQTFQNATVSLSNSTLMNVTAKYDGGDLKIIEDTTWLPTLTKKPHKLKINHIMKDKNVLNGRENSNNTFKNNFVIKNSSNDIPVNYKCLDSNLRRKSSAGNTTNHLENSHGHQLSLTNLDGKNHHQTESVNKTDLATTILSSSAQETTSANQNIVNAMVEPSINVNNRTNDNEQINDFDLDYLEIEYGDRPSEGFEILDVQFENDENQVSSQGISRIGQVVAYSQLENPTLNLASEFEDTPEMVESINNANYEFSIHPEEYEDEQTLRFYIHDSSPKANKKIKLRIATSMDDINSLNPSLELVDEDSTMSNDFPMDWNDYGYASKHENGFDQPHGILEPNLRGSLQDNVLPSIDHLPLEGDYDDDQADDSSLLSNLKHLLGEASTDLKKKGKSIFKKLKNIFQKGQEEMRGFLGSITDDVNSSIFSSFNDIPLNYGDDGTTSSVDDGDLINYQNPIGIKGTVGWSNLQKMSNSLPDLHNAITVMSFVAFSVFVANLGVNALANNTLGISFRRDEPNSFWNQGNFNLDQMIRDLEILLEPHLDDDGNAFNPFNKVLRMVRSVYQDLLESTKSEMKKVQDKITNFLVKDFSKENFPLGDISKLFLLSAEQNFTSSANSGFMVNGTSSANNGFVVNGISSGDNGFVVNGTSSANNGFVVNGTSSGDNGFVVNGTSSANNGFVVNGNSSANNGFVVNGTSSGDNGFVVNGTSSANNGFVVNGNSSANNGFVVNGNSSANSGFMVNGTSSANNGFVVNGNEVFNEMCYQRLLCFSHNITRKYRPEDSRNKLLPFWTFGIGWYKDGKKDMSSLLENLRAELAGESGRNCEELFSDCENDHLVQEKLQELEKELRITKNEDREFDSLRNEKGNQR